MNSNITFKYQELFYEIKTQIIGKNLQSDTKLDSIRTLATKRNISTTTVEKAYLQLLVEGYIYSIPKSGYYVSNIDTIVPQEHSSMIEPITTNIHQNNALTRDIFDVKTYKSILNKVMNEYSDELLYECLPNGEALLREEIRKYVLKERDVQCDVNQIIIGPGIQNLLHILLSLQDFETVSYLRPGFKKALNMFSLNGYQLFSQNTISDIVSARTDYLYISPSNIYPTGESLLIQDRIRLIKWAQNNDSYIIEDDYNFFIKYNNYTVPSIQSLDQSRVIYMGSFSKTLLPSMRISFMILPKSIYTMYLNQYQTFSQGVSKLEQLALALYFKEGLFYRHTKKLYSAYKKKNHIFRDSIDEYVKDNTVSLRGTESNLHVILDFTESSRMNQFIENCRLNNYKYTMIDHENSLIFPYSGIKNEAIKDIIDSLFKRKDNH